MTFNLLLKFFTTRSSMAHIKMFRYQKSHAKTNSQINGRYADWTVYQRWIAMIRENKG